MKPWNGGNRGPARNAAPKAARTLLKRGTICSHKSCKRIGRPQTKPEDSHQDVTLIDITSRCYTPFTSWWYQDHMLWRAI